MTTLGQEGYSGKTLRLVHATSYDKAKSIMNSEIMYPGDNGLFGGAIYFADCEDDAIHKCSGDGTAAEALIWADVEVGKQWILEGAKNNLTKYDVQRQMCDSVKGKRYDNSGWEYVIYDSSRVKNLSVHYLIHPDIRTYPDIKTYPNIRKRNFKITAGVVLGGSAGTGCMVQ
jgi:hypothetical protein